MVNIGFTSQFFAQIILWAFIPGMATSLIQRFYYSATKTNLPSNHPSRSKHYTRIYSFVVLSYLMYTIIKTEAELPTNFYGVLDLTPSASIGEIKSSYRGLSRVYHPDKLSSYPEEQQNQMIKLYERIQLAYETLKFPVTRQAYDKFGESGLGCKHCRNEKEYLMEGLTGYITFYASTVLIFCVLSLFSKASFATYWRLVMLMLLAAVEGSVVFKGEDLLPWFFPWRIMGEKMILLHQLYVILFIAVSQLGPLLYVKDKKLDMGEIVVGLEQISRDLRDESVALIGSAVEPFAGDEALMTDLTKKMENRMVDLHLLKELENARRKSR